MPHTLQWVKPMGGGHSQNVGPITQLVPCPRPLFFENGWALP
jgi:hypothetical protein